MAARMGELFGGSEPSIRGLLYVPGHIGEDEEQALLARVDLAPWSCELKRRVQHYGYRYDYKARRIAAEACLGALPPWLAELGARLVAAGHFDRPPDQVIINEYTPGQGIAAHFDRPDCFAEPIAIISLGSACVMEFSRAGTGERVEQLLQRRSLLVLTGDARYGWRHGIAARKSDVAGGLRMARGRRVSVTFRLVVVEPVS